jgi:hypothetical protein
MLRLSADAASKAKLAMAVRTVIRDAERLARGEEIFIGSSLKNIHGSKRR